MDDLIILQKCYDMIQYGYICLRQYPKSEKHTLAAETKVCMLNLLKLIIQANKRYYKKTTLQDIDVELETLRHYTRLAQSLNFLPIKKYENWIKMISEIGRLLGGWMRSIKQ